MELLKRMKATGIFKGIIKFFTAIFLPVCFIMPVCAQNTTSFIYINGSNTNDNKMKNWYETSVKKFHPVLKKKFEKNSEIKKHYKTLGGIKIEQEPVIFFWGDESKTDLDYVKSQLDLSKAISSSGAYIARDLIAKYLHDAIWVQKPHNMERVIDNLNTMVKKEAEKGNDTILYGYSAGTFITYEYMFNKFRYIKPLELFKALKADEDFINFVKENPVNDTCISALSYKYAGIGNISSTGHLILNQDKEQLRANYLKLNEMTELACAPDKKVKGIVNYASPLVLFYSDLGNPDYEPNYANKVMIKYIYENGIFWITVNFREDPLGYPTSRNMTVDDIEEKLQIKIENPSGVIYDHSSVWSKRLFLLAHTSYWSAKGSFSKAVVKSFIDGYRFNYDPKYQAKVLKRKSKKSEL